MRKARTETHTPITGIKQTHKRKSHKHLNTTYQDNIWLWIWMQQISERSKQPNKTQGTKDKASRDFQKNSIKKGERTICAYIVENPDTEPKSARLQNNK